MVHLFHAVAHWLLLAHATVFVTGGLLVALTIPIAIVAKICNSAAKRIRKARL